MNYGPRIPLHMQDPEGFAKAQKNNPSYESFRPHVTHQVKYRQMGEDRPSTHAMAVMRRHPDGTLDHEWAKNAIIDAIHNAAVPHGVRPVHLALLQVVFPGKYRNMEPQQAEIFTQLSDSEKSRLKAMVEAHLKEEENWNTGQGGGSVDGRHMTRSE
jgi:hypothetical protein